MHHHLTLQFGTAIDSILASDCAIAQARRAKTVLLSSAWFALPHNARNLVLLHELAHLVQQRRPGHDPEQSLEDEAWEAAAAWLRGRPYWIRGRARGPLNATAIVQGGDKGHPFAPPWYKKSPVEPIGGSATITVDTTVVVDDLTIDSILDQILAAKKASEFVVVCHGSGGGLDIPFVSKGTKNARWEIVLNMAADHEGTETQFGVTVKTPAKSDHDAGDLAMLKDDQVKALRAKMNQVHVRKLKHVAFRACNMGINKDALQAFRNFFGAASVSAPKQFDAYANFGHEIVTDLKGWVAAKRKIGFHIAEEGKVAFGVTDVKDRIFGVVAAATGEEAFKAWVKKHIVDERLTGDGVIFHGLYVLHPTPTGPPIYFVRDPEFIADIVKYSG